MGLVLLVAAAVYYMVGIRPQIVLAALDEMAGATQAHGEGDYPGAIALYQQFLEDAPESAQRTIEAHYYLGCCYENLGDQARAWEEFRWVERAYDRFCEQLPGDERRRLQYDSFIPDVFANTLYTLGQLAWQQNNLQSAGAYFGRLLEDFPDHFLALEVGEYLNRLGNTPPGFSAAAGPPPPQAKGQSDDTDPS